jgi:hypothetical protein
MGFLLAIGLGLLQNVTAERLVNLALAGQRPRKPCRRTPSPIVPSAVTEKPASGLLQFADRIGSFHSESESSPTLRTQGISPLIKSACRAFNCSRK